MPPVASHLFICVLCGPLAASVCLSVRQSTDSTSVCLFAEQPRESHWGWALQLFTCPDLCFFLLPLLLPLTLQFTCQKSKVDIKHKHTDLRRHTHTHTPVANTLERAGKIAKKLCLQLKIEQMAFGFSSLFRCLRFYLN